MAVAKWSSNSGRSSNILSSAADSLANGSESTVVTYDNTSLRNLYAAATIKLGSFNSTTGGSVSLRLTLDDGTDTSNKVGGDVYVVPLVPGSAAKVNIIPMVRLYPFSIRFSLVNNAGATLPASGNELYMIPYNEDVS
jgi:hypothetical protein